jgi:hypothetical protein
MCWDILDNLNNDYQLLFKYRVGVPTVAYFVSRRASLLTFNAEYLYSQQAWGAGLYSNQSPTGK